MAITIFGYHLCKALLDERGGTGRPAGLADIQRLAQVAEVWIGQRMDANYMSVPYQLIRTIETQWDAGRPGNMWGQINLGRILLEYTSPAQPGTFIQAWLDNLIEPCDGIAFDVEYSIANPDFPLTAEDQTVARMLGVDISSPSKLLSFRCQEIAIWARLCYYQARQKHPSCGRAIVYSGFPGEIWGPAGDVAATYGCDLNAMTQPVKWGGHQFLPSITQAQLAWFKTVELPAGARRWLKSAPNGLGVLHHIGLPDNLASRENYAGQIKDRLDLLRSGPSNDGLAFSDSGQSPMVWDQTDRELVNAIIAALSRGQSTGVAPASWGEIKNASPKKVRR